MFEPPTWIYILACAHGKYYVGRTTTKDRVQMHFDGHGSAWTKIHKPYKQILFIKAISLTRTSMYLNIWKNTELKMSEVDAFLR